MSQKIQQKIDAEKANERREKYLDKLDSLPQVEDTNDWEGLDDLWS